MTLRQIREGRSSHASDCCWDEGVRHNASAQPKPPACCAIDGRAYRCATLTAAVLRCELRL